MDQDHTSNDLTAVGLDDAEHEHEHEHHHLHHSDVHDQDPGHDPSEEAALDLDTDPNIGNHHDVIDEEHKLIPHDHSEGVHQQDVDDVDGEAGQDEADPDHDQHTAFLPSLQFSTGNDLLSPGSYQTQSPAGGPIRSGDAEAAQANFDHWPAEPQGHGDDQGSLQNANQFAQGSGHSSTPYDRPQAGTTYGTYDGAKPKRKRASPQQLTLLNNIFEMTYFPSSDLRLAIGKELDMAPRSVQIWFQNRRSLWRAKASQILNENKARKEQLMAEQGMGEQEAEAKVNADRQDAAAKQIADQRANDAVEFAINGTQGSLAFALHNTSNQNLVPGSIDDGSITRDDEAGAWSVLQAFHQARTGQIVPQGHHREQ